MAFASAHTDVDRLQKRWILGALGLALVIHVIAAWALDWYKIPAMEIPNDHSAATGPFTVKRIEINPNSLKPQQDDPIAKLPGAEPPRNPAEFNLDPNSVERALQTPQPTLATPNVPEPNKVIAATDLSQGLPMVESDSAKITADITKIDPAMSGGPVTSDKLAQDLINASLGSRQEGAPGGSPAQGDATAAGKLPGFATLAPNFKPPDTTLSHLPDPILLRLSSDVLFDFDSAQLKPEAAPLLSQAVAMITKYPQADIHIDGYSDSIGKSDYNMSLSQQRAEAVQAWLEQRVAQSTYQFKSQGHGSTNFIVGTQGSIEQQQPNRRVEILIQALGK